MPKCKKTLRELFEEFLREQEHVGRRSPETIKGYRAAFDLLEKVVPHVNLENVQNKELFVNFFEALRSRPRIVGRNTKVTGIKATTTATYHSKLKTFFSWLDRNRHIDENPLALLKAPNVEYLDRKFLYKQEIQKIFHSCSYGIKWNSEFVRRRNLAMLSVLLYCGLRRGELLGLEMRDIDIERRTLTVRAEISKSKLMRQVPLNSEAINALQDYLSERNKRRADTPQLWMSSVQDRPFSRGTLKKMVERIATESKTPFHLHRLRHTFAVNVMKQGKDISKLKQLLGHKDIRMTGAYLRCIPTDEMRSDVAALGLDSLI